VALFGASWAKEKDDLYEVAKDAGFQIAKVGLTVINGGYQGTMEASAIGAKEAGGECIGVLVPSVFRHRPFAGNEHLSSYVVKGSILERINHMVEQADAFLVLPGTVGTLTELCVAWNVAALAPMGKYSAPKIYCFRDPWEKTLSGMAECLGVSDAIMGAITYVDSAEEAMELLKEDRTTRQERLVAAGIGKGSFVDPVPARKTT